MIVDLRNSGNRVYFNGISLKYPFVRMRLVSNYSNKEILNDTFGNIELDNLYEGEGWFSYKYSTDITPLQNVELNEYYTCILEESNGGSWIERQRVLCKVLNNFNTENPDVVYNSNNENNEQYIYFMNE